jgi:hypothetical protein
VIYTHVEPLISIFDPEIGPNFHLCLKRIENIFNPSNSMSPDKLDIAGKSAMFGDRVMKAKSIQVKEECTNGLREGLREIV